LGGNKLSEWTKTVIEESGEQCGNCGEWRRLTDDYFIERCPNCGDDETYIFDVDEREIP
jgi:predicted RNA-binding Zn-ribbon protein involved in translation (DUF1610 family)